MGISSSVSTGAQETFPPTLTTCRVLGNSLVGLLRKYADTPMSLADATVVRICELNRQAVVWTLDNHLRIYRQLGRKTIPLLDWPRG